MDSLLAWLSDATRVKFWRGQAEHGGELWRKRGMLAHVEAETLDQNVYLYTLRQQLGDALGLLDAGNYVDGAEALRAILGAAEE